MGIAAVALDAASGSNHAATRIETALYTHRHHAVKMGQLVLDPHVLLLQDAKLLHPLWRLFNNNNNP